MKKIKKIEIRDSQENIKDALIGFPKVLQQIKTGDLYQWAILPDFEAVYYSEEATPIAKKINENILQKKIIPVSWDEINILAKGVGQFIDLVLIGCKDSKKLKYYQNDDQMIRSCDIVIINFDGCWWEVSCKDEKLMKKFLDTFKEVKIINW